MSLYVPSVYSQDNKILGNFSLEEHHDSNPDNLTIVIIIDGLSDNFFREHLEKAPNLSKALLNGAYYLKNTTCLPSCTGIGHAYILTGTCPNQHSICGLNYIDKQVKTHFNGLSMNIESLLNNSLSKDIKTIFENNASVKSASIWSPVTRGCDITIPYSNYWYRHAAKLAMEQIKKGARLITIWYPLLDPLGHYLGIEHPFRKFWWHRIDYQIGNLFNQLELNGYLNKSLIYITSDHGQTLVNKNLDLYKFFRKMGYTTLGKDHSTVVGEINPNNYDIFVCRNGYRFAHLYFGNNIDNEEKEKIKQILLKENAVRNLFIKVGDKVLVESSCGKGIINSTSEYERRYSYKVVEGIDPLLYGSNLSSDYMKEVEWKSLTIFSESPNVVPQIYQLMMSENSGDIILAAKSEYHFSAIPHKAAHGGLEYEELVVPTIVLFPEYANKKSQVNAQSLKRVLK